MSQKDYKNNKILLCQKKKRGTYTLQPLLSHQFSMSAIMAEKKNAIQKFKPKMNTTFCEGKKEKV